LYGSVYLLVGYAILIPLTNLLNMDPYFYYIGMTCQLLGLSKSTRESIQTYALPFRITSGAIAAMEGVGVFPVIVVLCVFFLSSLFDKVKILIGESNIEKFGDILNRCHLTIAPGRPFLDAVATLFTCCGLTALVVLILILLRLFWLLPFPINLIPPTLFVFVNFFLQMVLPQAVGVHESCIEAIQIKKGLYLSKYLRMKMNAARPLGFRIAVFGCVFFRANRDI